MPYVSGTRGSVARRFRRALLAAAAALWPLLAMPAAEADTVTLRDEAYVRGPKVTLGDVAEVEGVNAASLEGLELGLAPDPGASRAINAALVTARIAAAGFDAAAVEVTGAKAVRATTLHLEVTQDMLEEDLRRYIETQMPWNPADAFVDVDVPAQTVLVPDGAVEIRWRPTTSYPYVGPGAFRGEIRVDGSLKRSFLCKAHVDAYGDVLVAVRDIGRGKLIGPSDVAVEKRALSPGTRDVLQDIGEVLGSVARSSIPAGKPLSSRDVVPRTLIKRGQIVMVEVREGRLTVRTQARAKTDAREGDLLICTNPESKEEFQGMVRPDGTVLVD